MRFYPAPAAVFLLLLAVGSAPLPAQDFLFGTPRGQVTVRTGSLDHRAQGDLYDFITSELTVERDDFRATYVAADASLIVRPRVDLVLGLAHGSTSTPSEYIEFVGTDNLPIQQSTTLTTTPVTVSLRLYPLARGEAISRLAWVPARVTPYVGAGAGLVFYRFEQAGEFIDAADNAIFEDHYESSGSGGTAHVGAGTDVWINARLGINVDARYSFGSAPLTADYAEWERLDVGGVYAGVGLTFRW